MKSLDDVAFWLLVIYVAALVVAGFWFEWRKGRQISNDIRDRAERAGRSARS